MRVRCKYKQENQKHLIASRPKQYKLNCILKTKKWEERK